MATFKLSWSGNEALLDSISCCLTEILRPPAAAVALFKADDAVDDAVASWRLEAYFADALDYGAVQRALESVHGHAAPAMEILPDIDWVAHSLAGLGIVRAGRFVLYGSHDAARLPGESGDIAIRIEANEAFGTGHHPTTAGCLALLDRLAGMAPKAVLDLGTGSAALAIAAAKLWKSPVLATDIDARSAAIARENAALNGVGDLVEVIEADGFAHPRLAEAAPDFVFANILAGPLVDFAAPMAAHMKRGGRVMLAGLMADQEAAVAAAYEATGFRRINRIDHAVWPVLLFARI